MYYHVGCTVGVEGHREREVGVRGREGERGREGLGEIHFEGWRRWWIEDEDEKSEMVTMDERIGREGRIYEL